MQIEKIDISGKMNTRTKAFFRTIKQLKDKDLVRPKPYFKYEHVFYLHMSNHFWAEGTYWQAYNHPGFYRKQTRPFRYGYYHILGLTHEGHERARQSVPIPAKE